MITFYIVAANLTLTTVDPEIPDAKIQEITVKNDTPITLIMSGLNGIIEGFNKSIKLGMDVSDVVVKITIE